MWTNRDKVEWFDILGWVLALIFIAFMFVLAFFDWCDTSKKGLQ